MGCSRFITILSVGLMLSSQNSFGQLNRFVDRHINLSNANLENTCAITVFPHSGVSFRVVINAGYESLLELYNDAGTIKYGVINNQIPEQLRGFKRVGSTYQYTYQNTTDKAVILQMQYSYKDGNNKQKQQDKSWRMERMKVVNTQNPYVIGGDDQGRNNYQNIVAVLTFTPN